jgi:hypothetical protein
LLQAIPKLSAIADQTLGLADLPLRQDLLAKTLSMAAQMDLF